MESVFHHLYVPECATLMVELHREPVGGSQRISLGFVTDPERVQTPIFLFGPLPLLVLCPLSHEKRTQPSWSEGTQDQQPGKRP